MKRCDLLSMIVSSLLVPAGIVLGQQFERTDVSYAVTDQDVFYKYRLNFWKDKDSTVYRGMQFTVRPLDPKQWRRRPRLADCVPVIGRLWDAAADSVAIGLRFVDVGYPAEYRDVLQRQIRAFAGSSDWRKQLRKKKSGHEFRTLGAIMAAGKVYGTLDVLLQVRGYAVAGIGTEKHGYLRKEDVSGLDSLPALGGLKLRDIPIPFIVTIAVAPAGRQP